jgi:hypothetical protein
MIVGYKKVIISLSQYNYCIMIINWEETYTLSIGIREMDVQWSNFVMFHEIQIDFVIKWVYMVCGCVCVVYFDGV